MSTSTTGYRIAEVARRSGFSRATLRYYEEIGLLPPAARTEAGYRIYDERALDRLAFVARAKQLGCTLQEIVELARAWDADECAPVQHRLRSTVAAKIGETQSRIAELIAFAAELQATAAVLAGQPVDGACDATCGCNAVPAARRPEIAPVELAGTQAGSAVTPGPAIACSLGSGAPARVAEWQAVLVHVMARSAIDGGVRLTLSPAAPLAEIVRLMQAEQGCCAFLSFALVVDAAGPSLEVRAPAVASDVVATLFGAAHDGDAAPAPAQ